MRNHFSLQPASLVNYDFPDDPHIIVVVPRTMRNGCAYPSVGRRSTHIGQPGTALLWLAHMHTAIRLMLPLVRGLTCTLLLLRSTHRFPHLHVWLSRIPHSYVSRGFAACQALVRLFALIKLNHMRHRLCGPPSIPLSFILSNELGYFSSTLLYFLF
jgi:hypothetical protein